MRKILILLTPIILTTSVLAASILAAKSRVLDDVESSQIRGALTVYEYASFALCSDLYLCSDHTCGGSEEDCAWDYARTGNERNRLSCFGAQSPNFYWHCEEWREFGGSHTCSNWTGWCAWQWDDDIDAYACLPDANATGGVVNASSPDGCYAELW